MKQIPDNQSLPPNDKNLCRDELEQQIVHLVQRGSEPHWIQDIRLAMRRIEAKRREIWAKRGGGGPDPAGARRRDRS